MPEGTARRGGARSSADNGADALKSRRASCATPARETPSCSISAVSNWCSAIINESRKPTNPGIKQFHVEIGATGRILPATGTDDHRWHQMGHADLKCSTPRGRVPTPQHSRRAVVDCDVRMIAKLQTQSAGINLNPVADIES